MKAQTILATALWAGMAIGLVSCSETAIDGSDISTTNIVATINTPAESRTAVDDSGLTAGVVGLLWTDGDELGVFDANRTNHTRYIKLTQGTVKECEFGSATGSSFMPRYAYYPYNAENDGRTATSLVGSIPAEQAVGTGNVPGDWKVGRMIEETNRFEFAHLFSLVSVQLDATGTVLEGETLDYVKFSAASTLAGDFNFNALRGTVSNLTNTSNTITLKWPEGTKLDKELKEYFSVMPNIGAGESLSFEIKTTNYTASFTAQSKKTFEREKLYSLPLNLLNIHKNYTIAVKDKDGKEVAIEKGDEPEPKPEVKTGTFTCASLNVDGLSLKSGNAGSSGTTRIGQAIVNAGWDFFGVSEDFAYNGQLTSALTGYKQGTHRGNVSIVGGKNQDTDGLNFFVKSGFSFANESWTAYNDKKGDLSHGADEYIQKGYRHYEVTVAEGVVIDVFITHMNTYSGDGNDESNAYWTAQMSQLRQLRDAVMSVIKKNNRPAIIMGDTNLRYTRHAIKEQFIDVITANNLIVKDPWIEFHRPDYPVWKTRSLMINSKYYTDEGKYNTTDDICCYDNNKGEVVDKIFYINVPGAPLQLKATSYKNDDSDNFVEKTDTHNVSGVTYEDASYVLHDNQSFTITKRWGLADHFPAVASFEWTMIVTK